MTGCTGYSIDGQIVDVFIEDDPEGDDECLVNTLRATDDVVAVAVCCYFHTTPVPDYKVIYGLLRAGIA